MSLMGEKGIKGNNALCHPRKAPEKKKLYLFYKCKIPTQIRPCVKLFPFCELNFVKVKLPYGTTFLTTSPKRNLAKFIFSGAKAFC